MIIPFRNEEKNLSKLLISLTKQNLNHNHFEVLFVNDHSTDKGCKIIEEFKQNEPSISVTLLHLSVIGGKKKAIKLGQQNAQGNYVVQSDADCSFGNNWLKSIFQHFQSNNTEFLILPVHVTPKSSVISKFDSFDYASLQAVGLAMSKHNYPILCSGANLAYSIKLSEFDVIQPSLSSGDDIFLLQTALKNKKIISCIINSEVLSKSDSSTSFNEFIEQRKRWLSKNTKVNDPIYQIVSVLAFAANISILIALVLKIEYASTLILLKFISDYLFLKKYYRLIGLTLNGIDFLISFICYPFYLLYLSLSTFSSKSIWKGRIVVD
ncbi:MAG: glycosyltransferase [Salibacteraceae bacterium]